MTTSVLPATVLSAEFGSVTTRAAVFDVVDGHYRLIAVQEVPSTPGHPDGLQFALLPLLQELEFVTGLRLAQSNGLPQLPVSTAGQGVDQFVFCSSAETPRRVFLLGLTSDHSLQVLRSAVQSQQMQIVGEIIATASEDANRQISKIQSSLPDLIIVAGGVEGGARQEVLRLLESLSLAMQVMPAPLPRIIFCGNTALHDAVRATLPTAELYLTENALPALKKTQPQPLLHELNLSQQAALMKNLPNFGALTPLATSQPLASSQAVGRMTQFLARTGRFGKSVLTLDVGARNTVCAVADNTSLNLQVLPEIGIGQNAVQLLNKCGLSNILRWLTTEQPANDVQNAIYNKVLSPAAVPDDEESLTIEQALTREALALGLAQTLAKLPASQPAPDTVILSGASLRLAPKVAQSLLMLLDVFPMAGVFDVFLDEHAILPLLGSLAAQNPLAVVQLTENEFVRPLASVVVVRHQQKSGAVLRVDYTLQDGVRKTIQVNAGELVRLPLSPDALATVQLQALRAARIGASANAASTHQVKASRLGLIIDARFRPFSPEQTGRVEQNLQWLTTIDTYQPI